MMQALHILAMQVPFMQGLLSISPVTFQSWFSFFVIAATIIVVIGNIQKDKELLVIKIL
jgi:hypothetical protein